MKIIGVAGQNRSGKDSLAEFLIEKGYFGVSIGDIVRDEARKRHAGDANPISVANMTDTSNYLRATHGPDFALRECLARYEIASQSKEYRGLVVFSVRAPVEADFILASGGDLIWVETDDQVRYERSKSARREGEAELTIEQMVGQEKLQEKPQEGIPAEIQMNLSYIKSKATITIVNNGNDIEAFKTEAEKALGLV